MFLNLKQKVLSTSFQSYLVLKSTLHRNSGAGSHHISPLCASSEGYGHMPPHHLKTSAVIILIPCSCPSIVNRCVFFLHSIHWSLCTSSLVAQIVKNLPAIQETRVLSLGQENPLEEEMATHSSILAWRIPGMGYSPCVSKSWTQLRD